MTYQEQAAQLLEDADDRHEEFRRNPVTDGQFHRDLDPIRLEILESCQGARGARMVCTPEAAMRRRFSSYL